MICPSHSSFIDNKVSYLIVPTDSVGGLFVFFIMELLQDGLKIAPYEFRKAVFIHSHTGGVENVGYRVTLYCFFDGEKIHHFAHQSEFLDNQCFAMECGFHV